MTARDPNGWADLRVEQIRALGPEEFEEFCFDLVQCEAYDRHVSPHPLGPAGRHVPDGGRDILLAVKNPPSTTKQEYQRLYQLGPLTEDRIGRTVYSCKSGKNWLDDALDDIREERKAPSRAVEVLLEGGYFKLFISTVGTLDKLVRRDGVSRTPHAHLSAAFLERMKQIDPGAGDPADRIEIIDAQWITSFLTSRMPPAGPMAKWATRRPFSLVPLLHGLEEWSRIHFEERKERAPFADDGARAGLRTALLDFLRGTPSSSAEPTGWLVGPPGVGKTRLLIDALNRDPGLAQRARVAIDPERAVDALEAGRLLTRYPDVVLVVDDCPGLRVSRIHVLFRALLSPESRARLLVITPAGRDVFSAGDAEQKWFLSALEEASAAKLAAGSLGRSGLPDEVVQGIVRLSEGYPWFVTLLAREALAERRAPQHIREAMQWALASRHEAQTEEDLDALRLRRARCLLAASLTRRIDWTELPPDRQEQVARAVGLSGWQALVDTAEACVKRGILRRNLGWKYKYVTPQIVEREVIAWLLAPDGPDPGGKWLSRLGADFLHDFFETLERLDLPSSVLSAVAAAGLEELRAVPPERGALEQARMLGPRLRFIARHEPAGTAYALHQRISDLPLAELRARTDERRDLVLVLEELAARETTFEEAEDALFRLARAENEVYGNNATAVWSELFFPELNVTYRSVAHRLARLLRRMSDPEPPARHLALGGARAMLTTHASRRAIEARDGERPVAGPEEARRARLELWHALAEHFSDPDAQVAARAKEVAFEELRGAIRWGVGGDAMTLLAAHADHFSDADRIRLRDALASVRAYDEGKLAGAGAALVNLEKALAPRSFRERLRQHIGTWRAARLRKDDDVVDDMLAREGLAGDAPILSELDWLLSDAAVRAHVFALALGRHDEQGLLLEALRARARSPGTSWMAKVVFARYLGGWKEAGRAHAAVPVLQEMSGAAEEADSLALAIVEIGANEERLRWIEAALEKDLLGAPTLSELGRRQHWLSGVGDEAFERFCGALLNAASAAHASAALELLVDRAKESPPRALALKSLLLRAMDRLSAEQRNGITDHYWELGAGLLVEQGEATLVAELSVTALSSSSGATSHAWEALHRAAEREPTAAWLAVASALSRGDTAAGRLQMAFMFHRSSFEWPREEVLSWVDHDERRGRMVVSLVPRGAAELDPILRGLVQRFGAHSSVAGEIIARMHSTNGLVPSLADHDARHLAQARKWLNDSEPEVRTFAKRLVQSLEKSHAYHAAEEADERRRWGT